MNHLFSDKLHAQGWTCDTGDNTPVAQTTSDLPFLDCFINSCGENSDRLPLVTMNVNFHYIGIPNLGTQITNLQPDDPTTTADDFSLFNGHFSANLFIDRANQDLSNLQVSPTGITNYTGDSRIRINLYTDPSNADDIHGGVWFWPDEAAYVSAVNSLDLYQSNVARVVLKPRFNADLDCDDPSAGRYGGEDEVFLYNYVQRVLLGCYDDPGEWPLPIYSGILIHELFHGLNLGSILCHSFTCSQSGNNCASVDLDVTAECNSNSGNPCASTCGGNAGCNAFTSGSSNIMSNTQVGRSLSCCQWETVYGSLLSLEPLYANIQRNIETNLTITQGQNVVLGGYSEVNNITIEDGGKLTVSGELKVADKITVERGGELHIECAIITNRIPNTQWNGIIVHGDPSNHQWRLGGQRFQGFVRSENSRIENATYAVRLYEPDAAHPLFGNSEGGIFIGTDTEFLNNQEALSVVDYQNFNPFTGNPMRNFTQCTNCTFVIDNDYLGNYANDFRRHVYLRKTTGVRFVGCAFGNATSGLSFAHEKRIGIESRDADFFVGGLCTDNSTNPCQNYQNTTFRGLASGITAYNFSSANTFRVTRTDFFDNFVGIHANAVNNPYIVNNTFRVGSDLPPQFFNSYHTGLQLFKSTGYQVEANYFEKSPLVDITEVAIGSAVSGSSREYNEIYRNVYDGLEFGNLSNGVNRSSTNAAIGLEYRCNDNINNIFDFGVDEQASIAEDQGRQSISAGNCFSNLPGFTQSDFLNQGPSINYYYDQGCEPFDISANVIKLIANNPNPCVSRIPNDERGRLSSIELSGLQAEFNSASDAVTQQRNANTVVREYLINPDELKWNYARSWLNNKKNLESHFLIVDSWLYEKNATAAKEALGKIDTTFPNLSNEEKDELKMFAKLKMLQINALNEEISEYKMIDTHFDEIDYLAQQGKYYAGQQAQNMINSYSEMVIYPPQLFLPNVGVQPFIMPEDSEGTPELFSPNLSIAPNPADNATTFFYRLPEDRQKALIEIRSIEGRLMEQIPIINNVGQFQKELGGYTNGVYLYSLVVDGKIITIKRLVVAK